MKQIKERLKEVGEKAHTAGADMVNGEGILPTSLQKFKDVESLCKAYNSLESEFTKRCQRIKELEGKLEKLTGPSSNDSNDFEKTKTETESRKFDESAAETCDNNGFDRTKEAEVITEKALNETVVPKEKTVDNGTIAPLIADDKGISQGAFGNSAAREEPSETDFCMEESKTVKACDKTTDYGDITKPLSEEVKTPAGNDRSSDGESEKVSGNGTGEVIKFFKDYPESTAHIGEIEEMCKGDYSLSSLQRAYIEILKGEAKTSPVRETEGLSEAVRLTVIKDYLNSLRRESSKPTLMGGSGVIPMTPPVRPKNIAEAGALAQNIIKIK